MRSAHAELASFRASSPWAAFAPDERRGQSVDGGGAKVLIVEDDYLAAIEAEAALIEAGYEVVGIANTAERALALAQSLRPILAVMDIRLIGARDGVDAALDLFVKCGVRSIFATAHHDGNIRARAQPAAPLGWLAKPYSQRSLVQMVNQAMAALKQGD
jgi:DNA-binding NarL/FixJ family response regulator